jgi:hypothetical protein
MADGNAFLSVNVDTTALDAALSGLTRPRLDAPVAKALSDTLKNAKTKASSLIAKRTGLKSTTVVRPRILTDYVKPGDYQARIRSSRKPIPLIDFRSTRQVASGVSTRAWGKPQVLRSAFVATMPTGHRGVYRRSKGVGRLPIDQQWGPTIAGTFATPDVATLIEATIKQRIDFNLRRRIRSELRRGGR